MNERASEIVDGGNSYLNFFKGFEYEPAEAAIVEVGSVCVKRVGYWFRVGEVEERECLGGVKLEAWKRERERLLRRLKVERCCWFMCTATYHNYTSHCRTFSLWYHMYDRLAVPVPDKQENPG